MVTCPFMLFLYPEILSCTYKLKRYPYIYPVRVLLSCAPKTTNEKAKIFKLRPLNDVNSNQAIVDGKICGKSRKDNYYNPLF